ncbi:MAG: hypothetical protein WCG44_03620 [bacterium]
MKLHIKYLLVLPLLAFPFSLSPSLAHAQTSLDSDNYKIRLGNFNMTSGSKSSASYKLTDTVGQIAAEFFSSTGYHVKAGFQYIYTLYDFSFTISTLAINLGTLTPNIFSFATNTLTVTAPGQGYSVSAYEINRLKNTAGDTIPDTICDSGPCTESSATVWTTPTNNGFGYNASGNDVATDFVDPTYFRPFPDFSASEPAATIMTRSTAGRNRVATITYQVSPSSAQAAGDYSTEIIYIATPVY